MRQREYAMLSKEEIAQEIAYSRENTISYKQRLSELGVNTWGFYDAIQKTGKKKNCITVTGTWNIRKMICFGCLTTTI